MTDTRPNPDQLLAEVTAHEAKQNRGKLKVFFGMAAGVGKTYAMLEEARARAAEGLDVLVGYAEPHIRTETEALLLGMEILPYKLVQYRGSDLKELDLDGILKRRPALVCVDELAHTNAPGMRHPKRYQDVMELLDSGINVYTTLNVQHLESVNDIVERITGVKVRETLPDAVLEQADEVELVDISPEELLERFGEGKVYRPEQAERAARHFFTRGNLIALRELALRTTAQRVDAQMLEARRAAGSRATWEAAERILVCVGPSPLSARLVRAAKRLAAGLSAQWIAAYVETPGTSLSVRDRARLDDNLRLAQQLGARIVTLRGDRIAQEVLAYSQAHNVTKIVIGKPQQSRWRELLKGSAVDELVRAAGGIDIYVIRGAADEAAPRPTARRQHARADWPGYLVAVGMVAAATALGWPLQHGLGLDNINVLMLYLLGVLWVSLRHSRSAAVLASLIGVLAFDFCFVRPYFSFSVYDQQYIFTFAVMLLTALTISTLTHRMRDQAEYARHRERRTQLLLDLSRELAAARGPDEIAARVARHVADVLDMSAAVYLPDADGQLRAIGTAGLDASSEKHSGVAHWAFEHGQPAGAGTGTLPATNGTFLPMNASRGAVGVLGISPTRAGVGLLGPEQRQMAESIASHAALAVERAALAEEARQAWERVEAEFLRNTLLSGVSHDLRTPLAAIMGSVSALIQTGDRLSAAARTEMLGTVAAEAERMDRLINNLLDMTRLESGGLALKREWVPMNELVGSALHHMERRLRGREVKTNLPHDLPLIHVDPTGIEQVLANLLDNAAEYTPAGSPIEISSYVLAGEVAVEVADRGPGLPPGTERRVFEKFFRVRPDESRRGLGLGLAICHGIIQLHGGRISATNRPGGGAVFRFVLPLGTPPAVAEEV